jgi:hypothetical protein
MQEGVLSGAAVTSKRARAQGMHVCECV